MEQQYSRTQLIEKLNLSLHGKLEEYRPVFSAACTRDPEFLAHLIAWDYVNGQIKDTKIALPVITLATPGYPDELAENSLAHIAMQPPRELEKSLRFAIAASMPARRQKRLESVIRRYLAFKEKEPGKWNRLAIRHRRALKSLYALTHAPMAEWASNILFRNQYAPGSIFADVRQLSAMSPAQVAATIQKWHLSPLVVSGAMAGAKDKQKDSGVLAATMDQMSDTELVTRSASLVRDGVAKDENLKEKFRGKVAKASKSNKATLKTGHKAEEVEDEGIKEMLKELQERQIENQKAAGRGIEGNWLVISDCSSSQSAAIELGVQVAAAIARFVTGTVWLLFCNTDVVKVVDATGKSLEYLQQQAKFIVAVGGTSYGVGLEWAADKKLELNGVAIVGDGGENHLPFGHAMVRYEKYMGTRPAVYLYQTYCDPRYRGTNGDPGLFARYMQSYGGGEFTAFDLTSGKVDYYSLPNLVQSMNVSRFGVVEKIMACPLVTLDMVIPEGVAA